MVLIEIGEVMKKLEVCNCMEKCEVGKVNMFCFVCVIILIGCIGKEFILIFIEQLEELKEKGGNFGVVFVLVFFVLFGGGVVFYYFKFVKLKQNVKGNIDFEDFDFEDYDEDELEVDIGEIFEDEEMEEEIL